MIKISKKTETVPSSTKHLSQSKKKAFRGFLNQTIGTSIKSNNRDDGNELAKEQVWDKNMKVSGAS